MKRIVKKLVFESFDDSRSLLFPECDDAGSYAMPCWMMMPPGRRPSQTCKRIKVPPNSILKSHLFFLLIIMIHNNNCICLSGCKYNESLVFHRAPIHEFFCQQNIKKIFLWCALYNTIWCRTWVRDAENSCCIYIEGEGVLEDNERPWARLKSGCLHGVCLELTKLMSTHLKTEWRDQII